MKIVLRSTPEFLPDTDAHVIEHNKFYYLLDITNPELPPMKANYVETYTRFIPYLYPANDVTKEEEQQVRKILVDFYPQDFS